MATRKRKAKTKTKAKAPTKRKKNASSLVKVAGKKLASARPDLWDTIVERVYITRKVGPDVVQAGVSAEGELVVVGANKEALKGVVEAMERGAPLRAITISVDTPDEVADRMRAEEKKLEQGQKP